jgi:hypothetical protein
MSSSTPAQAQPLSEKLFQLMEAENRPFAFNDIHERIGKSIAKQPLQKALELLIAKKRIIEKVYGKQKVFCVNNKLNNVSNETVSKTFIYLINLKLSQSTAKSRAQSDHR